MLEITSNDDTHLVPTGFLFIGSSILFMQTDKPAT